MNFFHRAKGWGNANVLIIWIIAVRKGGPGRCQGQANILCHGDDFARQSGSDIEEQAASEEEEEVPGVAPCDVDTSNTAAGEAGSPGSVPQASEQQQVPLSQPPLPHPNPSSQTVRSTDRLAGRP